MRGSPLKGERGTRPSLPSFPFHSPLPPQEAVTVRQQRARYARPRLPLSARAGRGGPHARGGLPQRRGGRRRAGSRPLPLGLRRGRFAREKTSANTYPALGRLLGGCAPTPLRGLWSGGSALLLGRKKGGQRGEGSWVGERERDCGGSALPSPPSTCPFPSFVPSAAPPLCSVAYHCGGCPSMGVGALGRAPSFPPRTLASPASILRRTGCGVAPPPAAPAGGGAVSS